uniref:Uncharacterized protein n=1 Tax=Pararge aegeria TaxID=116150 RepID=S4PZB6_9NEOP
MPAADQMQYSLTDLDTIFTDSQEAFIQSAEQPQPLQPSPTEMLPEPSAITAEDFWKDVAMETGLDGDLDLRDIFDEEMAASAVTFESNDFFADTLGFGDPQPEAEREAE